MQLSALVPRAALVSAAFLLLGCGNSSTPPAQVTISSVSITPAAASITTRPDEPKALPLALEVHYSDGSIKAATGVTWGGSTTDVGAVDSGGVVTATGIAPGSIAVTAEWEGRHTERAVAVCIGDEIFVEMEASAKAAMSGGAEGAAEDAPSWEYPEEGTLFPARLAPPLIQWNAGKGNHVAYELILTRGAGFRIAVYTTKTEYQPTKAQWVGLGRSYGEPIKMELVGKPAIDAAAARFKTTARTVITADAALAGLVHYRSIENFNVMRIDTRNGSAAEPLLAREQSQVQLPRMPRGGTGWLADHVCVLEQLQPDNRNQQHLGTRAAVARQPRRSHGARPEPAGVIRRPRPDRDADGEPLLSGQPPRRGHDALRHYSRPGRRHSATDRSDQTGRDPLQLAARRSLCCR